MFSRIKKTYREYKELKYLAYHDSLTGLLNRNWLYENINQIKTRYVYFIDINDLHKVNENGHSFGDEYIKKAIGTIKHRGIFLRYAGDEFILFSDYKNEITTNEYYSVGISMVSGCLIKAINLADAEMIKSKLIWKSKNVK
ncbi:MAG: GGDEF domain-containing protein [Candidatus Omnitrophica bacterium]|nr:GGDEF domain-containing protein [Candidatus Omnitrophota bacterium]